MESLKGVPDENARLFEELRQHEREVEGLQKTCLGMREKHKAKLSEIGLLAEQMHNAVKSQRADRATEQTDKDYLNILHRLKEDRI